MAIGIMITSLLGMHTTCSHTLSDFYEQMFVVLMNKVQRLSTYRWMKKEHQYVRILAVKSVMYIYIGYFIDGEVGFGSMV